MKYLCDLDVESFRCHHPDGSQLSYVAYIPDFLSEEEEASLLEKIYANKWTQLSRRRLQNYGGKPSSLMLAEELPEFLKIIGAHLVDRSANNNSNSRDTDNDAASESKAHQRVVFPKAPNHVLINEYEPGQGIMAHEDGPIYEPLVAIISLKSGLLIEFKPHAAKNEDGKLKPFSLYLQPRSFLLFKDTAYTHYLHSIAEREVDVITPETNVVNLQQAGLSLPASGGGELTLPRSLRISLTIRIVKKTIKNKLIKLK